MFQVIYWLNLSYEYVENVGMTLLVCLAVPRGYISWSHYRSVCTCCVLRQGNTLSDVYRERKWMLYGFPKSRGICDLWGLGKVKEMGWVGEISLWSSDIFSHCSVSLNSDACPFEGCFISRDKDDRRPRCSLGVTDDVEKCERSYLLSNWKEYFYRTNNSGL